MAMLALAAAFLLASHFGIGSTRLRPALVARLGEKGYRALYSVIALAAIVWLVRAFYAAPTVPLWPAAPWLWFVPLVVVPVALLLVVGGVSTPNPTSVGREGLLDQPFAPEGVLRITRNPVMWGIGLWALAHLAPNGTLAGLLFFGSLAALALVGTLLIDHKHAARRAEVWSHFARLTSNVPLLAILQRRQNFAAALREIGLARLAATVALYVGLLYLHPWLIGVSPLPPL